MADTTVDMDPPTQSSSGVSNKESEKETQSVSEGANQSEESEDKKDEDRDFEKPLMQENDGTVVIKIQSKTDGSDTPTLPLPERVSKNRANEEQPSIFFHHIDRIRLAGKNSNNLIVRVTCTLFANLGWMMLVSGVPFLSIVQIIIGSMYIHDCPAEPKIPEYLIVSGVFGTIFHGCAICNKCVPKREEGLAEAQRRRCLCIDTILQVPLFVWFIAGCVWVYRIFEPEYVMETHSDYCNKILYLFTFWMFNIAFIVLILIITAGICCLSLIAMGSKKT